jgi:hypothetical protein
MISREPVATSKLAADGAGAALAFSLAVIRMRGHDYR